MTKDGWRDGWMNEKWIGHALVGLDVHILW